VGRWPVAAAEAAAGCAPARRQSAGACTPARSATCLMADAPCAADLPQLHEDLAFGCPLLALICIGHVGQPPWHPDSHVMAAGVAKWQLQARGAAGNGGTAYACSGHQQFGGRAATPSLPRATCVGGGCRPCSPGTVLSCLQLSHVQYTSTGPNDSSRASALMVLLRRVTQWLMSVHRI
jgi:hypothetical protein